jgi:outer membrane protein TolC
VALDNAYIQVRQHLLSNSFGLSDRLDVDVARAQVKDADLNKQEATEDLVLNALKAYWDAYVAQTQLQDAITARQQYQNLIGVVKRRGRFGLDKGGEYAQVMADYTDSDNKVKTASYDYLDKLKSLEELMQTKFPQDLKFDVGEEVPALPKLGDVKIEDLRKMKIAISQLENARQTVKSQTWRAYPTVDLIAKAASTGVDERAGAAYSEFVAGTKPDYFVGLELSTPLDSAQGRAVEAKARVLMQRSENNLAKVRADMDKSLSLLDRQLEQAFAVANGSIEAEKYRSRTVREQEVEYRQGRLALRDLLQTYRTYFDAQAKKVRAIGDYHIALNQAAAERDELVK